MCGICGFYHYGDREPAAGNLLPGMLDLLAHRGPDDEGSYVDGCLAMGMRRLSIIDIAGGHQPICNEDGGVVTVFNGEIYNYRELAAELRKRGHLLRTASDTEVIVHLYEDFAEECVHHLRGMFALAVWDRAKRRLFLARDRLGIKPLYYTRVPEGLAFASEIKALLRHPEVEAIPDLEALLDFLSLKYVPAPQTMFTGISALPPAHTLTCDRGGVTIRRYWELSFARGDSSLGEEEHVERLGELLSESVALRLRSDVPFGALLSGGIDSSLVVALMTKLLRRPVKTFSVGFERAGNERDELPYARLVASYFQTEHHEVVIGPEDFIDLAEEVIWHLDQPIADQATVATFMVSRLAARHVKMVLTGEGGDELFAGYARYLGERLSPLFQMLPASARSLALEAVDRLPGLRRPKIALQALCQREESSRLAAWFPLFDSRMKASLLSPELRCEASNLDAGAVFARQLARTDAASPLDRMLYVDTKLWLPDFLLLRGDKLSMANSLEARVPLLDHRLAEYAASLPPHLKLRGTTRKFLLKRTARALLPRPIIRRKKQGFPIPIAGWFRKEARAFIGDLLAPETLRRRGLFDPAYVVKLLREHDRGFADHSALLWGLASIEIWYRTFIDSSSRWRSASVGAPGSNSGSDSSPLTGERRLGE